MQQFDYYRPLDFAEAFSLLSTPDRQIRPIAGATDLIPHVRDGAWHVDAVVDIKGLPGLRDLELRDAGPDCGCGSARCLYVGAAVTMNEISRSPLVNAGWSLLAQGAASVGNEQVRNRATLGGNICTASPAADTAPVLLAMEATIFIRGPAGDRSVPVATFFQDPRRTLLTRGEIVVGALIPQLPAPNAVVYEKLSRRKAGDLSIVGVAVIAYRQNGQILWRIALGAVAPTPIRAPMAEDILNAGVDEESIERASVAAYGCCRPISDIRSSVEYRQDMIVAITRRAVQYVSKQLAVTSS